MPLKEGSSNQTFSSNVNELMQSWKKFKKIGNAKPKTLEKARKQALAIAFDKKRGG